MINQFEGNYAFLSNYYPSPFIHDGIEYPTVEHFFQAAKTLDIQKRKAIAAAATPGQAKRMGRSVELRPDWESVKNYIMSLGLALKFQNPDLAAKLIDTWPKYLVEGTTWHDRYWGVCTCDRCKGNGQNWLGRLLMDKREDLRQHHI